MCLSLPLRAVPLLEFVLLTIQREQSSIYTMVLDHCLQRNRMDFVLPGVPRLHQQRRDHLPLHPGTSREVHRRFAICGGFPLRGSLTPISPIHIWMGDCCYAYQLHSDAMLSKQGKYNKIRSPVNSGEALLQESAAVVTRAAEELNQPGEIGLSACSRQLDICRHIATL